MPSKKRKTRYSGPDFTKQCKSEICSSDGSGKIYKRSNKDYCRTHLQWLITNGLFPARGTYICVGCLKFAEDNINREELDAPDETSNHSAHETSNQSATSSLSQPQMTLSDDEETPSSDDDEITAGVSSGGSKTLDEDGSKKVADIIKLLKEGKIKGDDLSDLCLELGKSLSVTVFNDSKAVTNENKDISRLCNFDDLEQYLQERPPPVINLLSGLSMSQRVSNITPKKMYPFCLLLEQLYAVRNTRFIGPCSFSQGLLKWTIHGSRAAHDIDGATTASGSSRTLKRRFEECSAEANVCFDSGDVEVFADNVQRVGKTTRVRDGGTTPVHVATNVVFIQSQPPTSIQEDEQLKPGHWFGKTPPASLAHQMNDKEEDLKANTFRPYKIQQQQQLLTNVMRESTVENAILTDHVSERIAADKVSPGQRVCPGCRTVINQVSIETCPACKYTVKDLPDRSGLYGDVQSNHPTLLPYVKMGEIVDLNPNSIESIKTLLRNLKEQSGVGKQRKWVRMGFDGVPYGIASSIIDNTVVCSVCKQELNISKRPFSEHAEAEHPGQEVECTKLFDDVLLVPGTGHMEINLLRAVFALCKDICVDHIADLLGFRSKRAKEFITRGSNHHVTWQVFLIMYKAFAMELAYEYYADCVRRDMVPSQKEWAIWRENEVQNANYHLIYDLVHHYFMGIFCFRAGVRRNNSDFMVAGRQQVAPIMFIGRHRIYRKLIYRDMQTRLEAPDEVKSYIKRNESFSKSGDDTRGQGGDYVTEEENKSVKSNLPPGVPTLQNWQWASRCNGMLKRNRESVFRRAGMMDPGKQKTSIFNFEEEVQCVRASIRQSGMLSCPLQPQALVSLDGQLLHNDLVNMHLVLTENYDNFKKSPNDCVQKPVFVTFKQEAEYNDINNWTKNAIERMTQELINSMIDEDLSTYYRQVHADVSSSTKPKLISFYYEVKKALADERVDAEAAMSQDEHDE